MVEVLSRDDRGLRRRRLVVVSTGSACSVGISSHVLTISDIAFPYMKSVASIIQ